MVFHHPQAHRSPCFDYPEPSTWVWFRFPQSPDGSTQAAAATPSPRIPMPFKSTVGDYQTVATLETFGFLPPMTQDEIYDQIA